MKTHDVERQRASADLKNITRRSDFGFCERVQHVYWFLRARGLATPALERMLSVAEAERYLVRKRRTAS